jgi:hypothetical protein
MLFGETQELQNILDASRLNPQLVVYRRYMLAKRHFSVKPKNCRTLLMLLGTAQSLIDCIFAGGIAIEARNARDLLNILVMPIDFGTGGLDLSTPAIVLPDSALALALASASIFPNFTLLETKFRTSSRIEIGKQWVLQKSLLHRSTVGSHLGLCLVGHWIGKYPRIPFSSLLDFRLGADLFLTVADSQGKRRGICHPLPRWASHQRRSPSKVLAVWPTAVYGNHKLRVHDSSDEARIHERVPSHCIQCRIALMNGRLPRFGRGASVFSDFGWRHFGRLPFWFYHTWIATLG